MAILRGKRVLVPSPDDPLEAGDELVFVCTAEVEDAVRAVLLGADSVERDPQLRQVRSCPVAAAAPSAAGRHAGAGRGLSRGGLDPRVTRRTDQMVNASSSAYGGEPSTIRATPSAVPGSFAPVRLNSQAWIATLARYVPPTARSAG